MSEKSKINNIVSSSGTSLASLLTVAFVVLKLTHIIDWSWVWVLAPLWIGAASAVVILIVLFIITIIVAKFSD